MRRLTLRKETVVELATVELSGVVGGTFRTKYDCTISHDVCAELSEDACVHSVHPRCLLTFAGCVPTQTC